MGDKAVIVIQLGGVAASIGGPGVRDEESVNRPGRNIHRSEDADPMTRPGQLGNQAPARQATGLAEVADAVVCVSNARVQRGPLHPRLQGGLGGGVGAIAGRGLAQTSKIWQFAGGNEPLHQHGGEFVEFDQKDGGLVFHRARIGEKRG